MKTVRLALLTVSVARRVALSLFPVSPAAAQDTGYTLAITGGDSQNAHVGTAFALPLQVIVTDSFQQPGFRGGGHLYRPRFRRELPARPHSRATTGTNGVASAAATANLVKGGPYAVTAAAERSDRDLPPDQYRATR